MSPAPTSDEYASLAATKFFRTRLGLDPDDVFLIKTMPQGGWLPEMLERLDCGPSSPPDHLLEAVVDISHFLKEHRATWAGLFRVWEAAGYPADAPAPADIPAPAPDCHALNVIDFAATKAARTEE